MRLDGSFLAAKQKKANLDSGDGEMPIDWNAHRYPSYLARYP